MAAGSTDKVGKRLGGKTSEAYLRLRDGKPFVLACQHSRMGRRETESPKPEVSILAGMEPMFNGFHTIQANKEKHRNTLMELVTNGQSIRGELDSLIAIPHKTHGDPSVSSNGMGNWRALSNH